MSGSGARLPKNKKGRVRVDVLMREKRGSALFKYKNSFKT